LVVGEDEREHAGGDQPGGHQRQQDAPEAGPRAGPVDGRRLLELARHGGGEVAQHPDRDRQRERGVDEDQADQAVEQVELAEVDEQRDDQGLLRQQLHDQQHDQVGGAELELEPAERDRGEQPDERARDNRDDRDEQAVLQEGPVRDPDDRPAEDRLEVRQRRVQRYRV